MANNSFAPDIVMLQEVTSAQVTTLLQRMRDVLGNHFSSAVSSGGNAVIWNNARFSQIGQTIVWAQQSTQQVDAGCGNGKEAVAVNLRDNDASSLFLETRNIVAASVHFVTNGDNSCLEHTVNRAGATLNNAVAVRRMTLIGGDFNRRPDTRGEAVANGLEKEPNCWYQKLSAPHWDDALPGQTCGLGSTDSYYDAAWIYPGSGGGTNPTSTSFCEQFTHFTLTPLQPDEGDLMNSCTDFNDDNKLDRGRIDYIWFAYENQQGNVWRPSLAIAAAHVGFASADLGLSFDPSSLASNYSDHRAVQSLLTWPVLMNDPASL